MRSSAAFYVFPKWKNAKEYAFGSRSKPSLVPQEDKDAYVAIFEELVEGAERARAAVDRDGALALKPMNFSPTYGSRGHRPVDLWVSICGAGSEPLGQMPQVYAIASDRGLEVGFAVSIDEADYHDPAVKARNRLIVPLLNAKLPAADDPVTAALDRALAGQGGWAFNAKTRLVPGETGWGRYGALADMLASLRESGSATGGGAVCRVFGAAALAEVDVSAEFERALRLFMPLIGRCAPTPWDAQVVQDEDLVADLADTAPFDPTSVADGRLKVLAAVARRQGQAAFRKALLKAYNGRCAITGTAVASVLQAAHICPYIGPGTNHVSNGLLLRADVHTLFDLRLLKIEPATLKVRISEALRGTLYEDLEGRTLAPPSRPSERPSLAALQKQFEAEPMVSSALAGAMMA